MSVTYSFILPLIIHLLIFCNGIGNKITVTVMGGQYLSSPRINEAQLRERRLEMLESSARGSGTYSVEAAQMRHYRVMERQMRQIGGRTRRTGF